MIEAKSSTAVPKGIWMIALVALLPFPISALYYAFGGRGEVGPALLVLLTWSAVVLAFLGGVRWGLESARPAPRGLTLAASVISPVGAWILLLLRSQIEVSLLLCGLLAAFMGQWLFDHATPDSASRYPSLSTTLTLGACLSLAVALEHALRM